MNNRFTIPRRHRICTGCEHRFEGGDIYTSLLVEDVEAKEGRAFTRSDYCCSCWAGREVCGGGIHWKSTVPVQGALNADEQNLLLLDLLRDELERKNPSSMVTILALLLVRKKKLIARQQIDEGSIQLFEVADTEEMLAVPKHDLRSICAQTVEKEIEEKLLAYSDGSS